MKKNILKTCIFTLLFSLILSCSKDSIDPKESIDMTEDLKVYTTNESGITEKEEFSISEFKENYILNFETPKLDLSENSKAQRITRHRLNVEAKRINNPIYKNIFLSGVENQQTNNVAGSGVVSGRVLPGHPDGNFTGVFKVKFKTVGVHIKGDPRKSAYVGRITQVLKTPFPNGLGEYQVGNYVLLYFTKGSPNLFAAAVIEGPTDELMNQFINPGGLFEFGNEIVGRPRFKLPKNSKVFSRIKN